MNRTLEKCDTITQISRLIMLLIEGEKTVIEKKFKKKKRAEIYQM